MKIQLTADIPDSFVFVFFCPPHNPKSDSIRITVVKYLCLQIIENSIEVEENELLVTLEAQGLVGLVHCTKQV